MIRHRNYYAMVTVADDLPDHSAPGDVMLLYLPLAHNFGRLMHLSGPGTSHDRLCRRSARRGARPAGDTADAPAERAPGLRKVHGRHVDLRRGDGVKRKLVDWALDVGRRESALRQQGRPLPRGLALQHRIAERLVFSKVKERLGAPAQADLGRRTASRRRSRSCSTPSASASSRAARRSARPRRRRTR